MFVTESLESITGKLSDLLTTKTVFGEPLQLGDVTLIPVVDASFGFGAGGGEGQDEKKHGGTGGGGGGGGRLSAKAVIVVRNGEVTVLPLGKGGGIDKILEAVPGIMEKLHGKKADEAKTE